MLECVQRRGTKMTQGMEYLPLEDRVKSRRFWEDLRAVFQYLKSTKEGNRLFSRSIVMGQRETVSNERREDLDCI